MTLSDRFEHMEAKRVPVKPVHNMGASQRRGDVDSRRKVGRQTQFDARRQGVINAKPAMRTAQSKVVAPRQQRPNSTTGVQGRGRGRGFQAVGGRTQKPGGMPPRTGSQTQKANGGRGASAGRSTGRGAGRTSGRGNSTAAGRGAGRNGRTGRGGGKTGGRGNKDNGFTAKKDVDLDEGLDEYWFKAGKGPDPKAAALDRGLDSYWNKANDAKANGDAAAGNKMESDAPDPVADVPGVDPEL